MAYVVVDGIRMWTADRPKFGVLARDRPAKPPKSRSPQRRTVADKRGLLDLKKRLRNVAEACRRTGWSRDSYYRFKRDGVEQKPPRPRLPAKVEAEVLRLTREHPEWGKHRMALNVSRALGYPAISPNGVTAVWRRRGLTAVPKERFRRPSQRSPTAK
jgi:hypothetical protein